MKLKRLPITSYTHIRMEPIYFRQFTSSLGGVTTVVI